MAIFHRGWCGCKLEMCVQIQGYITIVGSMVLLFLAMKVYGVPDPSARTVRIFLMVDMSACLGAALLLLIGVYQPKRNNFLLPFIATSAVQIILTLVFRAARTLRPGPSLSDDLDGVVLKAIASLVGAGLGLYYVLVVVSLWQQRREGIPTPKHSEENVAA